MEEMMPTAQAPATESDDTARADGKPDAQATEIMQKDGNVGSCDAAQPDAAPSEEPPKKAESDSGFLARFALSKKAKWRAVFEILAGILIGGCVSVGILSRTDSLLHMAEVPFAVLCTVLSYVISINMHHITALLCGKRAGYRLYYLRVLFWEWHRRADGTFRFCFAFGGAFGGLCVMEPPEYPYCTKRHIWYYALPSFVNFLFAVLCALPLWFYPMQGFSAIACHSLLWASLTFGLLCMIPYYSGYFPSDGLLICNFLQGKVRPDHLVWLRYVRGQMASGVRPRDLVIFRDEKEMTDPSEREFLNEEEINSVGQEVPMHELLLLWYRYLRETDAGNQDEANILLFVMRRLLPWYSVDMRAHIYYELCFRACLDMNIAQAEYYYDKSEPFLRSDRSITACRIRAYYQYYVKGDVNAAFELCRRGFSKRRNAMILRGCHSTERDLLASLEGICLETKAMQSTISLLRQRPLS